MKELLYIAVISTFIADISQFANTVKRPLEKWLDIRIETLKPLDCPLCLTFWLSTIYLIIRGFSLDMWCLACVYSAMTPAIGEAIHTMRDTLITALRTIQKWTDRLTRG
jgi:hypothetical protein